MSLVDDSGARFWLDWKRDGDDGVGGACDECIARTCYIVRARRSLRRREGSGAAARPRAEDKGEHKVVRHSKKELVVCW